MQQFEVGSTVKVVADSYGHGMVGEEVEVHFVDKDDSTLRLKKHDGTRRWAAFSDVEPVESSVKLKKGDIIKPLPSADEQYSITDTGMVKAEVLEVTSSGRIRIKVLKHQEKKYEGQTYQVEPKYFKLANALVVGATVKLLSGGGNFPLYDFEDGEHYEVVALPSGEKFDGGSSHKAAGRIQIRNKGKRHGYALPEELEVVTSPTSKEVETKDGFAVGDEVLLMDGGGYHPLNGFQNGNKYTVIDINPNGTGEYSHGAEGRLKIKGSQSNGYPLPEQLRKVVDGEVQFKAGDIVTKNDNTMIWSSYSEGDILEVIEADEGRSLRMKRLSDGKRQSLSRQQVEFATKEEIENSEDKNYILVLEEDSSGGFKKFDVFKLDSDGDFRDNDGDFRTPGAAVDEYIEFRGNKAKKEKVERIVAQLKEELGE